MENPATGLVEYLRRQHAAGRPVRPFMLFGRDATPEAIRGAMKRLAEHPVVESVQDNTSSTKSELSEG